MDGKERDRQAEPQLRGAPSRFRLVAKYLPPLNSLLQAGL